MSIERLVLGQAVPDERPLRHQHARVQIRAVLAPKGLPATVLGTGNNMRLTGPKRACGAERAMPFFVTYHFAAWRPKEMTSGIA